MDTGATTNSTGNSFGITDMKTAQGSVTKMGNGAKVKTKAIGTLKGTICDKSGSEIGPVTINDIHLLPGSPFNIISGTKLLVNGFKLSGDVNAIKYSKNELSIMFDIKIKTVRSLLFVA